MVGRRRKFWVLEALKTGDWRSNIGDKAKFQVRIFLKKREKISKKVRGWMVCYKKTCQVFPLSIFLFIYLSSKLFLRR